MKRTSRTAFHVSMPLLVPLLLVACGGGAPEPGPLYVLGAGPGPLRYVMEAENTTRISIPGGGEQKVESSSSASFTLEYGQPSSAGLPFTVLYESFELTGAGTVDATPFLNQAIRGVIDSLGSIQVTEAPEFEAPVPGLSGETLGQLIGPLAIPMPPGGSPTDEPWSLRRSTAVGGGLTGEANFEGTARFTTATEWESHPARLIVSEGTVRQRASGTPQGAPGEVEVESEGSTRTTYAWDPARGVVLHVAQQTTSEGTVTVVAQGMVLPVTNTSTSSFTLTE